MVLIVGDQELHVHRSILTLLSPIFKAMLDGNFLLDQCNFKEARKKQNCPGRKGAQIDGTFFKSALSPVHV